MALALWTGLARFSPFGGISARTESAFGATAAFSLGRPPRPFTFRGAWRAGLAEAASLLAGTEWIATAGVFLPATGAGGAVAAGVFLPATGAGGAVAAGVLLPAARAGGAVTAGVFRSTTGAA